MDLLSRANRMLPLLLFLHSLIKKNAFMCLWGCKDSGFCYLCVPCRHSPPWAKMCILHRQVHCQGCFQPWIRKNPWSNRHLKAAAWQATEVALAREEADDNYRAFCFLGTFSWLLICLIWNMCLVITVVVPIRVEVLVGIILLPFFLLYIWLRTPHPPASCRDHTILAKRRSRDYPSSSLTVPCAKSHLLPDPWARVDSTATSI